MIKEFNVGVKGVIRVGDKCLIVKSIKHGRQYWDIPGGRIDGGESIEDTLKRELSEELPTLGHYEVGEILNAYRLSHDIHDGKALLLLFYKVDAEIFDVELSAEHTDHTWVSVSDLDNLLNDQIVSMEKGYYDAIKKALQ